MKSNYIHIKISKQNMKNRSSFREPKDISKLTGFTLIEILVVIAVIALLASVILVALNGARAKGRDAARISDMTQMATAMELFYNNDGLPGGVNAYPTAPSGSFDNPGGNATTYADLKAALVPNVTSVLPSAPLPPDGGCSPIENTDGGNNFYWDGSAASLNNYSYTITFCLGAAIGGFSAGPHTITPGGIK
jgi:prepilin-type N-terminal cleavage/methylation domain-containing protein